MKKTQEYPSTTVLQIFIIIMLVALFTMSVQGKSPEDAAKLKSVLGQEQKAMVLSHLRANPEPRSVAVYNEYADKKQSQQTVVIANLD